jgi:hypothetical protein
MLLEVLLDERGEKGLLLRVDRFVISEDLFERTGFITRPVPEGRD